ncbi:UNVERIFIED_CONTAM: hypothetical protein Slati_1415700 [Sesamum latifolium]|uniref:Retrotransposon gag domain-containing protein n=1 Tax=Sesamum latifolium TaxID=2727402 RepID=A0AAW2X455_9LAMI
METINSTLCGSQASGVEPSSSRKEGEHQEVKVLRNIFLSDSSRTDLPLLILQAMRQLSISPLLPAESVRSFARFSSLFQHQFSSSKKYQKSIISLFGIKQEDNETLRAYVQRFNTTILDVLTIHQEVLVSAFTQGLRGGPLFESLAKKPTTNFLDVLARAEKYMNLEDAWLVRKSNRDRRRENELFSSSRNNPLDPKNKHYTQLITSPARILMAVN